VANVFLFPVFQDSFDITPVCFSLFECAFHGVNDKFFRSVMGPVDNGFVYKGAWCVKVCFVKGDGVCCALVMMVCFGLIFCRLVLFYYWVRVVVLTVVCCVVRDMVRRLGGAGVCI